MSAAIPVRAFNGVELHDLPPSPESKLVAVLARSPTEQQQQFDFVRRVPSLPLVIRTDERRRVKAIRQGGRIRDTYGARIYRATVPVASTARTGKIYYAPDRRQWRDEFSGQRKRK